MLDDGDGTVAAAEFLEGIEKMALTDLPMEQFRMMKQIALNRREISAVREDVGTIESHMNQHFAVIEKHLNSTDRHMVALEAHLFPGAGAGVGDASLAPHHAYDTRPKFPPRGSRS